MQRVGLVAPLRLSGPGRLLRRRGRRQSEAKSREQRGTPAERARFAPEGHRSDVKPARVDGKVIAAVLARELCLNRDWPAQVPGPSVRP